jgi:predicted phage tail protein
VVTGPPNLATAQFAPSQLWSVVNGATVTLFWTAPTASTVTSYILEAGAQPGGDELANADVGPATTFTATNVAPGTYYVRVRARLNNRVTDASNEIVVAVAAAAPPCGCGGAITAPTNLSSTVSRSNVTLLWSYPSSATASSFMIEAGSYSGGANLANFDTQSIVTTYFAQGVGSGTYFVRVRAKNACGVSAPSNEITVTVR